MYINENWFMKVNLNMLQDSALDNLTNDGILLYSYMLNRYGVTTFADENGEKYIIVTEQSALKFCRIKRVKFYALKKQLRELGLIRYNEQTPKKRGVSTPIYVVDYTDWKNEKRKYEMPDLD